MDLGSPYDRVAVSWGTSFHLMGAVVVAFGVVRTVVEPGMTPTDVAEAFVPFATSLAYFEGGRRVGDADLSVGRRVRIVQGTLAFCLLGFCLAAVILSLRALEGQPVGEEPYVLFVSASGAGAVGLYTALYHQRLQKVSTETASLNHRLQVTQRVLRHNLRNEVTVLRGYVDALEPSVDRRGRGHLSVLDEHVDRLDRLSSKAHELETVWQSDERVSHDLAAAVEAAVDRLDVEDLVGVSIVTTLPEAAHARVHPRVDEALDEALDNALRHNDGESLRVEISVTLVGDEVLLSVADDGTGVPHGELDAIRSGTETQLHHASGLGLWLIYWIVAGSEGRVELSDNDPTGTVVTMRFPAADPEVRP